MSNATNILTPTGKGLINRLAGRQMVEVGWYFDNLLTVQFVSGADFQFIQFTKHIELGDGQTGQAIEPDRVIQNDRVQPSASPASTGGSTELSTGLLDMVTDFIEQL